MYKKTKFDSFIFQYYPNDFIANLSIEKDKFWEPHITNFVKEYASKYNIKIYLI